MLKTYKLYREYGIILFNSHKGGERFWISYEAARHGGGNMYDLIDRSDFDAVLLNTVTVLDLYRSLQPRDFDSDLEHRTEEQFDLRQAIAVHKLIDYIGQEIVVSCKEVSITDD